MLENAVDRLRHDLSPDHPMLGRLYHNLANVDFVSGTPRQAGLLYREALENLERFGSKDPTYLSALADYAVFLRRTGHKAEARSVEAQVKTARAESSSSAGMTVDVSALRPY